MSIIKNNREIPKKNYYVVLVVSILVIIITLYIRTFYLSYVYNKNNSSIFNDKTINQINSDDFDFALSEITEGIIYVSYNGTSKIRNMEKRLYKEVEKNNLNDMFIYWDITDIDKKVVINKLMLFDNEEIVAPMLIYVKDGQIIEIVDSKYKMIDYNTLNNMLSKYGII